MDARVSTPEPSPEYSRLLQRAARLQRESSREFNFALRRAKQAVAKNHIELALSWCRYGANVALLSNPGFFFSAEMEHLLGEIGQRFGVPVAPSSTSSSPNRFLHLTTTTSGMGGHTRAVSRWIETCAEFAPFEQHSILVSRQRDEPVPDWIVRSAQETGGQVFQLSADLPWMRAAAEVRARAADFDVIILHTEPIDLLPNLALYDRPRPVMFFNHTDHFFSLGTGVAQVISDMRTVGQSISKRFRSPRAQKLLLPLPLLDHQVSRSGKTEARRKLGLPVDAHIALTIGEPYKYSPLPGYNFSALVQSLCARDPKLLIVGIGISEWEPFPELKEQMGGRFLPLGFIFDRDVVELYYSAADIYLDSFPCSSLTAVLDAARRGLPVQRLHFPYQPLTWCDDPGLDSVLPAASTQEEYAQGVLDCLAAPEVRRFELGSRFRNAVLQEHTGRAWKSKYLDPAIGTLTSSKETAVSVPLETPKAEASVCFGLEMASWGADWPAGMFVAGTLLGADDTPLSIRIAGVLHSIKPLLFDTAGDGMLGKRFLMFRWLIASTLPRRILDELRRALRVFRKRSRPDGNGRNIVP